MEEIAEEQSELLGKSIGSLAARDHNTIKVFEKYGLDYCCGGKKILGDACVEKDLNPDHVINELEALNKQSSDSDNYQTWSVGKLATYIVEKHHAYVNESIPTINVLLEKVIRVHGAEHPELHEVGVHFNNITRELSNHMHKEEMILFPYIQHLSNCERPEDFNTPSFQSIKNPVRMMEAEHEDASKDLFEIRKYTSNYTPPKGACMSYLSVFKFLEDFDTDLIQHIHLENNILFPKSIALEEELINKLP